METFNKRLSADILYGVSAAFLSIFTALLLLKSELELAITFFSACFLYQRLKVCFDENRETIWSGSLSPWKANALLAQTITSFFLVTFVIFLLFKILFIEIFEYQTAIDTETLFANSIIGLFKHNLTVLSGAFILGLFFRLHGVLLTLIWNAYKWSDSFSVLGQHLMEKNELSGFQLIFPVLSVAPQLIIEVVAFVLAGMIGAFISIAIGKYNLLSDQLQRVGVASLAILAFSTLFLLVASTAEVVIAQQFLEGYLRR